MNRKVTVGGRNYCYETLVSETARKLARHLTAPKTTLDFAYPFEADEGGRVSAEVQERVATMTYAEARRIGISKAGLWDMKRRAAEGKPLRLYGKVARRLSSVETQH